MSDYSITIDHLLAEGDKVAYRVTHKGTHQPTGKKIQITNTCILRIAKGKIAENWGSADTLHVMQQLGVLPPTEEIWRKRANNVSRRE
jgi:predicted ester cyclase